MSDPRSTRHSNSRLPFAVVLGPATVVMVLVIWPGLLVAQQRPNMGAATTANGNAGIVDVGQVEAAIASMTRGDDTASAPLPAGTRLDGVSWEGNLLRVNLTMPLAVGQSIDQPTVDHLSQQVVSAIDPARDFAGVRIYIRTADGQPYELLNHRIAPFRLGDHRQPEGESVSLGEPPAHPGNTGGSQRGAPVVGTQPQGALSGVTVFVNAGHGWTAGSSSWFLQRPLLFEMIEDYGNLEQLNYFVRQCYLAGATVVPYRPVGYQPIEVVLDQDDPEVTYTGTWTDSSGSPYYENGRTVLNPAVSYRFAGASVTETAVARYTPNLPAADFYPVYSWVLGTTNRTTQTYRIQHSGGATEVVVDHRLVGQGWVYLGNFYFDAGTSGYVEVSNKSPNAGVVIADAIRFGSGVGDVVGSGPGTVSGFDRDEEAGRYWAESEAGINAVGLSSSIYDCCSSDQSDNVGTAARWAQEMNNTAFNNDRWRRIYIEFHSNAGSGTSRGTVALITGNATTNQAAYALTLGEEIERDMLVLDSGFEHTWGTRTNTFNGSFGAISTTNNGDEFDATILEVAFHDNQQDAQLLLDPKVRDAVAHSSVQGIIRFLNSLAGSTVPLAFPPAPPRDVEAVTQLNGDVIVSWSIPLSGDAYGDPAQGYRIYRSTNGKGFDAGLDVGNVASATLTDVVAGQTTYIRVAAYNAGGESVPTETLAVRRVDGDRATFLIVDGFDRIGRAQNPRQTISGVGTQRRPIISHVNTRDYTIQVGSALAAAGATFDSTSNEAVRTGSVDLNAYGAVVWILGEESSADSTFDSVEQPLVEAYLNGGGRLFASGAEIAWDLDNLGNGVAFYNNFLKADYVADDANTYNVVAGADPLFAGLAAFSFDNGTLFYDTEFPDVIAPLGGAVSVLSYSGGTGGTAAVKFDGTFRLVNLGFAFETITDAGIRDQMMDRVVGFFFDGTFDADRDGDVDLADLADLTACWTGPNQTLAGGDPCLVHDADGDLDVDLDDAQAFQSLFTGP